MHKQEFEVRIQNGKKLIEEAIALTSGGGTKVPWEFFRYWLGKKQKGYNSRRFYLMENGENGPTRKLEAKSEGSLPR